MCLFVHIVRSREWRGLETNNLSEEFWVFCVCVCVSILKSDHGKAFNEGNDCKITISRPAILGYLLVEEPKHIERHTNKQKLHLNTESEALSSLRICGVGTYGER